MNLESRDFLIRDCKDDDRDIIIKIEESMPWTKVFSGKLDGYKEDYNRIILDEILKSKYYWIIERKNGDPLGSISLDIDSDTEAHIYVHPIENANMTGVGIQLLGKAVQFFNQNFGINTFYAGLWNEEDPSIAIFEEAGYEMEEGSIEFTV